MMLRTRMKLWVVRDLQDGAVLFLSDRKPEAEKELTYMLGTRLGPEEDSLPTIPVLECYAVRIGRMIGTPEHAESVERRVESRRLRQEARLDQQWAMLRDGKGGVE